MTHPLTNEDISYLAPRLAFKKRCCEELKPCNIVELDESYFQKLWHTFQVLAPIPLPHVNSTQSVQLLECQALLDFAWFERNGLIWRNLSFDETREKLSVLPEGSWLMRTSSQHNHVMNYAQLIVLAYTGRSPVPAPLIGESKQDPDEIDTESPCPSPTLTPCPSSLPICSVFQFRFLYVQGVGIFNGTEKMPIHKLSALLDAGYRPCCDTLCELIQLNIALGFINILLQVRKEKETEI